MEQQFDPDAFRRSLLENRNYREQVGNVRSADNKQRRQAERDDQKGIKPKFLRPNDIAQGDLYDTERTLTTTLGLKPGEAPRQITHDDLRAFKKNIETLANQFKGGITTGQVINLSNSIDIERANKQIKTAIPVSRKAGVVHFITNASAESDVTSHHVHVEFLAFSAVVLDPNKQTKSTIKNRLQNGKIKFECDCGRFTYWFRYMATLGNYVHGRKEAAFPKIRNPNLSGVGCKHTLRVMQYIRSSMGGIYLENAVDKDRKKQLGARSSTGKKDIGQILEQQVKAMGKARQEIKPKLDAEIKKLDQKAKAAARRLASQQSKEQIRSKAIAQLEAALRAGVIDRETFEFLSKSQAKN